MDAKLDTTQIGQQVIGYVVNRDTCERYDGTWQIRLSLYHLDVHDLAEEIRGERRRPQQTDSHITGLRRLHDAVRHLQSTGQNNGVCLSRHSGEPVIDVLWTAYPWDEYGREVEMACWQGPRILNPRSGYEDPDFRLLDAIRQTIPTSPSPQDLITRLRALFGLPACQVCQVCPLDGGLPLYCVSPTSDDLTLLDVAAARRAAESEGDDEGDDGE